MRYRSELTTQLMRAATRKAGATIFAYPVVNPQDFGVVDLDGNSRPIALEEKPTSPRSNLAVTGLYFYDHHAIEYAKGLRPSSRGELEITDLNRVYLQRGELYVEQLGRGSAWLDGGTPDQLYGATQLVRVLEERTGLKIACPEEVAFQMGFIGKSDLNEIASGLGPSRYRTYLEGLAARIEQGHPS